ncbi:nudix hydrolase [Flammeovirgaceae bacterium 311]|nr:nudix hydrolase [Flammeovirgaceae bacterium 311]
MKIFINDISVNLAKASDELEHKIYDVVLDARSTNIDSKKLIDDVLVKGATLVQVQALINMMHEKDFRALDSITFSVVPGEYKSIKKAVKKQFKIVKAGGGIVEKDDQILLIYRKNKWDLPKGKLDKGEGKRKGALREVEEECNVKAKVGDKITHTWHTYIRNGKKHLKKTHWYRMECINDKNMKPQLDEGITDVRWMGGRDAQVAMVNSFRSIRHVIKRYYSLSTKLI